MGSGGGHAALHSTSQAGAGPHTAPQSFLPFLTLEALPAALLTALLGPAVAAGEGAGAAAAGAAAAALGCLPLAVSMVKAMYRPATVTAPEMARAGMVIAHSLLRGNKSCRMLSWGISRPAAVLGQLWACCRCCSSRRECRGASSAAQPLPGQSYLQSLQAVQETGWGEGTGIGSKSGRRRRHCWRWC